MDVKKLFDKLYWAETESEVDSLVQEISNYESVSWVPYGENESFFGVIENQQASPIPALVEKITNSIDAILTRRCYEEGIQPKAPTAPRNIDQAIEQFFPNSQNWDLPGKRAIQAENIQILAVGPRNDTSLIIFDDGEGQHPDDFKNTFLSLLRGNKNEIQFVQGKYNMGGAGAVVFCGKKRYQLIASKRYDKSGQFGFSIIRKHPLTTEEEKTKKNTWYEYLVIDNQIPRFDIETLDLGLYKRQFTTGTIVKLYSYNLPPGARSVISRDLNQSINEYLFEPALPVFTIDNEERYPKDVNLVRHLYGLKRRLEEDSSKYIKTFFSETRNDSEIGPLKITVYVFNPRIDGKTAKETKESIKREFFKNNMSVLFSLNGQVHGSYTSEFISRSLKFNLLKDYLLIHVDCTNLNISFRNELFMASRDRLKNGEESTHLRHLVAQVLSKGHLQELYKEWKDSITTQSDSANDLLRDFSKNLPLNNDLMKLLSSTFALDLKSEKKKSQNENKDKPKGKPDKQTPFNPKRFPTIFNVDIKTINNENIPFAKIPLDGEKTIPFSTDVEDQYFDRIEEPGELKIAILSPSSNDTEGGTAPGTPKSPDNILDVSISSPNKGKIRVNIHPNKQVNVGDSILMQAKLTSPNGDLDQIFLVQISNKEGKHAKSKEPKPQPDNIGLPNLQQVFKEPTEGHKCWDELDFVGMNYDTVMHPFVEGEKLETIFINMDSNVLKSYKSKLRSEEQLITADKRYVSAVYFHTLFLYMISKNRKYQIQRPVSEESDQFDDVDLTEYLKDIFDSYYSEFLMNFEMSTLIESLSD